MALRPSFPGPTGVTSTLDGRKDFAGLVIRDTSGNPRPGIFARSSSSIVSVVAGTWTLSVGAYEGALVRDGVLLTANDGATTTPANTSQAPGANSRIDVLYAKQNENANGYADGATTPVFGWVYGTASATPTKPSLSGVPGALEIATVQVPTGATSFSSGGVVVTPTYQYTALTGGRIPVRTKSDLTAITGFTPDTRAFAFDTQLEYRYDGTGWRVISDQRIARVTLSGSTTIDGLAAAMAEFDVIQLEYTVTGGAADNVVMLYRRGGSSLATGYAEQGQYGTSTTSTEANTASLGVGTKILLTAGNPTNAQGSARISGIGGTGPKIGTLLSQGYGPSMGYRLTNGFVSADPNAEDGFSFARLSAGALTGFVDIIGI